MAHILERSAQPAFPIQSPKPGILRRWSRALGESRRRSADEAIGRYVATSGGFTDATEREIERRYLAHSTERL